MPIGRASDIARGSQLTENVLRPPTEMVPDEVFAQVSDPRVADRRKFPATGSGAPVGKTVGPVPGVFASAVGVITKI